MTKNDAGAFSLASILEITPHLKAQSVYTDTVISEIAKTLRFVSPRAKAEFPAAILEWAAAYWAFAAVSYYPLDLQKKERRPRTGKQVRKELEALQKKAAALAESLASLSREASEKLIESGGGVLWGLGFSFEPTKRLIALASDSEAVARVAGAAILRVGTSRRKKSSNREARIFRVRGLAYVYERVTGRKAGRITGDGVEYGPFLDFCIAALAPIEGATVKPGLTGVIKEALADVPVWKKPG